MCGNSDMVMNVLSSSSFFMYTSAVNSVPKIRCSRIISLFDSVYIDLPHILNIEYIFGFFSIEGV